MAKLLKIILIDILVKPGGHFKFGPLEKIADIFGRDLGANFFRNGPWNSILPSNLTTRRVVMELGYMTILFMSVSAGCLQACQCGCSGTKALISPGSSWCHVH